MGVARWTDGRPAMSSVAVNERVAALLQEYAELLSLTGGEAFKVRVYEKAARSVRGYPTDVSTVDGKGLRRIPNVGRSIAAKIGEFLRTGSIAELEALRTKVPAGVRTLLAIPTMGPKRAMEIYQELQVDTVEELAEAIRAGRLHHLRGFGEKAEQNVLHGIEVLEHAAGRIRLDVAAELAERVVADLSALPGCRRCCYAGSLRRMRETVGDLDILAAAPDSAALMAAFCGLPYATEVVAHGRTKSSIRTGDGVQVDLRVVPRRCGARPCSTSPAPRHTTSGCGRSPSTPG
jgi:DNA polymerase (family 10)